MTSRRRKWLIGVALVAIVVAVGAWVAYLRLLPWIVRREVNAAFASVGLSNVKFDVEQASLFGTRLEGSGADDDVVDEAVGIGEVSVRYSPWDAINGELRSISVRNARLEIDLDEPLAIGAGGTKKRGASDASFDLPFERLELNRCALVLKRGDRELRLPIDGSIVRRTGTKDAADLTITSAIATSNLHVSGAIDGAAGRAHFTASSSDVNLERLTALLPADVARDVDAGGKVTFALEYHFDAGKSSGSLQLHVADAFVDAQSLGVSATGISAAVTFDDLLAPRTPPDQMLRLGRVTVAGQQFTDAAVTFHLAGPRELKLGQLRVAWGGGVVHVEPFALDPTDPVLATRVVLERVGLREIVALVTQGRATGDGTVSGSIPFSVDLRDPARFHFDIGEGVVRADAPGALQLGEASDDFGDLMAKGDPTFESDPIKRELRESVVEAVRDFEYDLLQVGFRPTPDGDVAAQMRIHGRGRGGSRLPLHLGLNVEGLERGLEAYLAAKSRVLSPGE
jgi:hypothetical protein